MYLNVIIWGASNEEHTQHLELNLERLSKYILRISKENYVFAVPEENFFG